MPTDASHEQLMPPFSIPPLTIEIVDDDIAAQATDAIVNAANVIHAAVMGQDLETSAALIATATKNALRLADSRGLVSIALPAFGTGVGGFPIAECARLMIQTVRAHAPAARSLRLIRFVLFGQTSYRAFDHAARELIDGAEA